jgi:hypothetical protein
VERRIQGDYKKFIRAEKSNSRTNKGKDEWGTLLENLHIFFKNPLDVR